MRRRPTIRLIIVLLLFLAGGAIVNVAVAWGTFVLRPCAGQYASLEEVESAQIWNRFDAPISDSTGLPSVERVHYSPFYYQAHAKDFSGRLSGEVVELGAGWPMTCLIGQWWNIGPQTLWLFDASRLQPTRIEDVDDQSSRIDALPCYPIWPGFAINTIFYAAILWLIFFVPSKLKRTLRRRRGLCPACAYPVGTSDVCTECGAPVIR
jgi:hypothetical protein